MEEQAQPSQPATESAPAQVKTSTQENYVISDSDLAELGIKEAADEEGDPSFDFSNVANPKLGKEVAKEEENDELDVESKDGEESEEKEEDDWLKDIKKDLDVEDEEPKEPSEESKDPLEVKEIEIERFGIKQKIPLKEAIKLAQQGYDYTQKTQSLAEDKREFERKRDEMFTDLNKREAQLQETINEKEQLDYFFDYLKNNDPDFYQHLEQHASQCKH